MTETYEKLVKIVTESSETIENYAKDNTKYKREFMKLMDGVFDYGVVEKTRRYMDSEASLIGVEVQLYYGGPGVLADTEKKEIVGTWGLESYRVGLSPEATAAIEDYVMI